MDDQEFPSEKHYYPFPSKLFSLLFILVNSQPMVFVIIILIQACVCVCVRAACVCLCML